MEILYRTVGVNVKWDTRAFTHETIPRTDGWDKRTDLEEKDAASSVEATCDAHATRRTHCS